MILIITGPAGSGKTLLATRLARAVNGGETPVLSEPPAQAPWGSACLLDNVHNARCADAAKRLAQQGVHIFVTTRFEKVVEALAAAAGDGAELHIVRTGGAA
ncbi:MAG: hypothetical protein L0221_17025 [Chloroflexi bacterium]|nr:hypothetical protein [Chloroflexota bacterium]